MIQQFVPISFTLIGDGTSTVFKQHLNQMFGLVTRDGSQLTNTETHPSSVTATTVFVHGLRVAEATVNGNQLTLTFNQAPAHGQQVRVNANLYFGSE